MSTDLVKRDQTEAIVKNEMTVTEIVGHVQLIQNVMAYVMKEGEHYGIIPGCGSKPALLKPGAEKLSLTFRLAPKYQIKKTDLPNNHREYEITCRLVHINTGQVFGEGVGSCSTMESKYRWRESQRKCPKCGATAIIKGKAEYGGGWLCFQKKGGCNAKFKDGDTSIEGQICGKVENPDIVDQYNTVLKMAKKRAHVDATLTATAASDIFAQDIEDFSDMPVEPDLKQSQPTTPAPSVDPTSQNGNTIHVSDEQYAKFVDLIESNFMPSNPTKEESLRKQLYVKIKACSPDKFDELYKNTNEFFQTLF